MAQLAYGSITITDTNDIESIYIEYCRSTSNQLSGDTVPNITVNWGESTPPWVNGQYIWQRSVIKKSGIDNLTYGTPVCLTGAQGQTGGTGRSLTGTETKYTSVASNTTQSQVEALAESNWSSNVPPYNSAKPDYWVRIINTYDKAPLSETIYYKDQGLTDAISKANDAWNKADQAQTDASNALSQANAANQATALLGGHFIYNAEWQTTNTPHSANVVEYATDAPAQWKHNVHIGSNGIKLRYNEISYSDWTESGLTLYKPPTEKNNILIQGAAAATLTTNGLVLSEGGIVAGTLGTNNYLYISSIDHPTEESGITINGFTPDPDENSEKWREVIGTNFGVTNAGTLYASNAYISGEIHIGSGHIANGVTISSGSTETKTLESVVTEIDGILYYQYTPSGGPTYDVYTEEDDEHNIHYYYIDDNEQEQEVQYEDLDKTIYYQYTPSGGITYDVYTKEDDDHIIHYYYIDDNEQEQEVQYEDLDKVDGEVVIVDGEVVIVYKNGINKSIESFDEHVDEVNVHIGNLYTYIGDLNEQIDTINGAIIIDSSIPSITIKAEKTGTEATAQTVFTESRISFQKIIDNQEIEVLYIDSTENEGVIDINNTRVHNSLRIGELELFNLNGGIGIRRT